jgi:glycosyltransferase involved in cell wall biosynthesis
VLELVSELLRAAPRHQFTLGIRPAKYEKRGLLPEAHRTGARIRPLIPPFFQIFTGPIDLFHSLGSLRVLGAQGSFLRRPRLALQILTLHDLIPMEGWLVPDTDSWVQRRTKLLHEIVARIDGIITDSEFVRRRVLETFSFPEDRIRAVPLGVNHERFRPTDPNDVAKALARSGIDKPYIVSFSVMYPRKNPAALVRAFARSRASRDGLLVLGGKPIGEVFEKTRAEIDRLGLGDRVRLLGYVRHEDVPLLLGGARAAVFPSLYEGFGLPVLEALASGAPLASSNATSMPEIGGDACEYFDPASDESMAAAIDKVWCDGARRVELVRRGLERAKLYTWERTARETLAFYDHMIGLGARRR